MLERRKRMLGINGKQWNDIQWTDVEEFLNEIEESFFFEFKKDEVSGAKLFFLEFQTIKKLKDVRSGMSKEFTLLFMIHCHRYQALT